MPHPMYASSYVWLGLPPPPLQVRLLVRWVADPPSDAAGCGSSLAGLLLVRVQEALNLPDTDLVGNR